MDGGLTAFGAALGPLILVGKVRDGFPPQGPDSRVLRMRAAGYSDARPVEVAEARAVGIDLAFIDETAPFGEVCGYEAVYYTSPAGDHAPTTFTTTCVYYAIRRVSSECFGGAPGGSILVSDYAVLYNNLTEYRYKDYRTPPRWQPVDAKAATKKKKK